MIFSRGLFVILVLYIIENAEIILIMKVTHAKHDNLTKQAKTSPRLRMNLDLRNGDEDRSQSMLNAIETEASLPIHRHHKTTETMVCLRIQRNSTSRLSCRRKSSFIWSMSRSMASGMISG